MRQINNNDITIIIDESIMEIRSIKYKGVEFCYQQNNNWKKNWPILFPICGSLKNGKYLYKGKEFELPRHGFFRDIKNWELKEDSSDYISFSASSNSVFKDIYPFEFNIEFSVGLINNKIENKIIIKNTDSKDMAFSIGFHPAFLIQKDGSLEFEKKEIFYTDGYNIGLIPDDPKNNIEIWKTNVSEIDFNDSKFYLTKNLNSSYIKYMDNEKSFSVDISKFKTFLLWSESNESDYICIEPWFGVTDKEHQNPKEIFEKDQIISIKPNDTFETSFLLEVNVND